MTGINPYNGNPRPKEPTYTSSPWITIKSVLATIITLLLLSAGLLLLPIIIVIILAIIIYAIYKIFFSTKEFKNND